MLNANKSDLSALISQGHIVLQPAEPLLEKDGELLQLLASCSHQHLLALGIHAETETELVPDLWNDGLILA